IEDFSCQNIFINMSDVKGDDVPAPVVPAGPINLNTALQEVLKTAVISDGLVRGLNERALDKRQAHLCVLANNCDKSSYVRLTKALWNEHQISLIKVNDNKKLGEWSGLCKIEQEGKRRKVVVCSCVVVRDWGKEGARRAARTNEEAVKVS
uniref:40S ribosomal protein S12 n=1 Tax=Ciona savignyi TaxID=51511 RepID=H2YJS0_CIOSA